MSRRRGEFEHRTSIFEGAFRAWSHLGGLPPEDLESKPNTDLDPLTNPIENDPRVASQRKTGELGESKNPDGTSRREYPYEPLPRSGLAHPYVQAILSPWLGPDADNEAIQLGLTTLRTWWQHRRKGESGSAIAALGTEKMKGVVEGYTRHFFTLAHCLVVQDKEQPPRTLHARMKELEKARNKRNKKKNKDESEPKTHSLTSSTSTAPPDLVSDIKEDLLDSNLSPLERLHAAQRRQLASSGMIHPEMPATTQVDYSNTGPLIPIKGKCMPGKIDLPGTVEKVNHVANQLAHRGGGAGPATSSSLRSSTNSQSQSSPNQFGDPNTTPVVFVSSRGDIMIALEIDGITCAHCVKIVETVLRGCNGNKSPIDGLLDAAADQKLSAVLIKIDKASNAKRVGFESMRNLSLVGYTAKVKEMGIVGKGADQKSIMDLGLLSTAFEVVANTAPEDFFDWRLPCTCPDNGVLRQDCPRHSQMNTRIFESFDSREKQVVDYMAGCGMKYGMPCTCGPDCRCKNCPIHCINKDKNNNNNNSASDDLDVHEEAQIRAAAALMQQQSKANMQVQVPVQVPATTNNSFGMEDDEPIHVEQNMDFFALEAPKGSTTSLGRMQQIALLQQNIEQNRAQHGDLGGMLQAFQIQQVMEPIQQLNLVDDHGEMDVTVNRRSSQRNPSIISYGGPRHMSMNSETTFGRAMSGLSALSIDWENLEDFDLEVDHSAHINNNQMGKTGGTMMDGGMNGGDRKSVV